MISASRRLEDVFFAGSGIGDNCNCLFELLRPILSIVIVTIGPLALPLPGIDIVLSLMSGLIVIARVTYFSLTVKQCYCVIAVNKGSFGRS